MSLTYRTGDVTNPMLSIDQFGKPVIIPHVVNDKGVMGAGVAKALYTKWPAVREDYMRVLHSYDPPRLGHVVNTIAVEGKVLVQSMVAQSAPGISQPFDVKHAGSPGDMPGIDRIQRPPIRYGALAQAMRTVSVLAWQTKGSIHAPRFGSDLAGGDWDVIESLILELWVDTGIDVTIYDYQP